LAGARGSKQNKIEQEQTQLPASISPTQVDKILFSPTAMYGTSAATLPTPVPLNHPYARKSFLESTFKIEERGSTVLTEIRAGTATFLTTSYIIVRVPLPSPRK